MPHFGIEVQRWHTGRFPEWKYKRCRWQAGDSQRKIALGTGLSRDTIAKYVAAAQEEGIVRDGLVATAEQLSRLATIGQPGPRQAVTPGQDQLEPSDQIYQWLTGDRLQLTPGVAGSAGMSGIVSVVAPLRSEAELAAAQPDHGAPPRPGRLRRWTSAGWA